MGAGQRQDVSHGCLNLTSPNAQWFYKHSLVGDPVIVHGAKGAPKLQLWQGGDWTMSWSAVAEGQRALAAVGAGRSVAVPAAGRA